MDDFLPEIRKAVTAVGRNEYIPMLLQVLCEITGLGFAAVARVAGSTWGACAVQDDIHLGITPGCQLALGEGLYDESRRTHIPMFISRVNEDEHYPEHPLLERVGVETYCSVPITLGNGRYFGNLCALDSKPASLAPAYVLWMFTRFAALIGSLLDSQTRQDHERAALLDERAEGELREQAIAILGHELRNPLQAVYAGADRLASKLSYPAHAEIAGRIKTNARRMSSLIDDVFDFARGRLGGGLAVELTEVGDINGSLLAVIQELQDAQPDCRIHADIRVGRPVRCDLGRLQQVASNLLANALTHGRPDNPIKISACTDAHDLVLEVWNAGEPIPSQSLDKIFEPFWRHSASASRNGLGLGLHICSEIVRAHGGRLTVTSTARGGTRFTARLPVGLRREAHATQSTTTLATADLPAPALHAAGSIYQPSAPSR